MSVVSYENGLNFCVFSCFSYRSTWVLLLYSNQQISHTVVEAPKTITNIMNDLEVFVTTSKEQIVDVTTGTTQQAIFSINHDLDSKCSLRIQIYYVLSGYYARKLPTDIFM